MNFIKIICHLVFISYSKWQWMGNQTMFRLSHGKLRLNPGTDIRGDSPAESSSQWHDGENERQQLQWTSWEIFGDSCVLFLTKGNSKVLALEPPPTRKGLAKN